MAEVHMSKEISKPPSELWEHIGDFVGLDRWMPGVPPMESENEGKVRRLGSGENAVIEELVAQDDLSYTYRIVQGPLPVKDYVATLSVTPSGDGCLVEWKSTFEPNGVAEEQAVAIVQGIYSAGLAGL